MRLGFLSVALVLTGSLLSSPAPAGEPAAKLTPTQLDVLLLRELPNLKETRQLDDEQFLRRASLDLVGRQPTPEERATFLADTTADKRARLIDRLLDSPEFGKHWANYWSDTISYRVPPPELTFLNYTAFKGWLADRLNANTPFDQITRAVLTAEGKLADNPSATFIAFHQGNAEKLAAETARIFLGVQIQCAQCHDHKFDVWKREQFHQLAAFFARAEAKLTQKSAAGTVVKDRGKGEHQMPDAKDPRKKGAAMPAVFLTGEKIGLDKPDAERRVQLARLVVSPENPWFGRSYVNRVWARLMGRGFYDPVDNMADYQEHLLPKVHEAMAGSFVASGFDVKELFRLVMKTDAYQRPPLMALVPRERATVLANKLQGDQVFDSLVIALALPNKTPPVMKPTAEIRFPPPPKSTRDLVVEKFGFDPSFCPDEVSRNMGQAMLLMNNDQVQAQINADPKSGTLLSKLLEQERDDRAAVVRLFEQVLARKPTEKEVSIALEHVKTIGKRGEAFEDVLWGLINSAEFTTRR